MSSIPLITLFCKQNSLPFCPGARFCSAFLLPQHLFHPDSLFPWGMPCPKSSPWMEQTLHPLFPAPLAIILSPHIPHFPGSRPFVLTSPIRFSTVSNKVSARVFHFSMLFSIYETFGSLGKQIGFGSHPFSRASVLSVNSLLTAEQLQVLGEEHITKRL